MLYLANTKTNTKLMVYEVHTGVRSYYSDRCGDAHEKHNPSRTYWEFRSTVVAVGQSMANYGPSPRTNHHCQPNDVTCFAHVGTTRMEAATGPNASARSVPIVQYKDGESDNKGQSCRCRCSPFPPLLGCSNCFFSYRRAGAKYRIRPRFGEPFIFRPFKHARWFARNRNETDSN